MSSTPNLPRYVLVILILFVVFAFSNFKIFSWINIRGMDFAFYWQAGSMNLLGEYVYDQAEWTKNVIRPGLDAWFHYPLPLAVLLTPLGLMDIEKSYVVWVSFSECTIALSMLILLNSYNDRSLRFDIIVLIGIFLFRPMFTIIYSGQLDSYLFLFLCLFLFAAQKKYWFWSGFALSMVSLKPSFGLIILVLMGIWFLLNKNWRAILGVITGAITLLLIGIAKEPNWVMDYLSIGQQVIDRYLSINTTLWALSNLLIRNNSIRLIVNIFIVFLILLVMAFLFTSKKTKNIDVFSVLAIIVPISLLLAPYSWSYDQILLLIPITFITIKISQRQGDIKGALFLLAIDSLAIVLFLLASFLQHDVWSTLISLFLWVACLYIVLNQETQIQMVTKNQP